MTEQQELMNEVFKEELIKEVKVKAWDELYHHAILCDKAQENHFEKVLTWWTLADLMASVMDCVRRTQEGSQ